MMSDELRLAEKISSNETRARVILMALRTDIAQLVRLLLDGKRKKGFLSSYLRIFYERTSFSLARLIN